MKKWLLAAIILLGLGLRLWGIGFGLPGVFLSDETMVVHKAVAMGSGDFNPHFFSYPTFFIYIVAFAYGLLFAAGRFLGLINSVQDFQTLFFVNPTLFYFMARGLNALFGTATIWVTWKIGKRIYSEWVGLLGALLLSLCYLHVRWSHFAKVDIALTFWMTLCILFLCKLAEQRDKSSWRSYLWAGAVWGLALSTKYTAVYLGPVFLFVHLWRLKQLAFKRAALPEHGKFICAMGTAMLAFFITSPFVVLDSATFLFYYHRHSVAEFASSFSFSHLLTSFIQTCSISGKDGIGLPLMLLAGIGFISGFFKKNAGKLVLIAFLLAYFFFFLSTLKSIFHGFINPILPLLCLFAAGTCHGIFKFSGRYFRRTKRGLATFLLACLVWALWPSLQRIFLENRLLCRKDTRIMARDWIHEHIPGGTRLAVYGVPCYSPPLHESRNLMQAKHDFVIALGALRGGNYSNIFAGPRQFAVKLAQPGYPPVQNYYIHTMVDAPFLGKEIPASWELCPDFKFSEMKAKGIEYVIFPSHFVNPLSHAGRNLEQDLLDQAELLVEFDYLNDESSIRGLRYSYYTFLVPLSGHSLLKRIGPKIRIYRI